MLSYSLQNSTVKCGTAVNLVINISNPSNSNLTFRYFTIRFYAGDADDHLFAAPAGGDVTNRQPPTSDLVTYAVIYGQASFGVVGANRANPGDHSMVASITPVGNVKSVALPSGGIQVTLSGTINMTASTAKITVTEGAQNRGTNIPNSDYYTVLRVTKSS